MKQMSRLLTVALIGGLIGLLVGMPQFAVVPVQAQTVNSVATVPSTTLLPPTIAATGTDASISLRIQAKGASPVQFGSGANAGIHIEYNSQSAPVLQCGGGTLTAGATDVEGEINTGLVTTTCNLGFGTIWTNKPICTLYNESRASAPPLVFLAASGIGLSLSATGWTTSDVLTYHCYGKYP